MWKIPWMERHYINLWKRYKDLSYKKEQANGPYILGMLSVVFLIVAFVVVLTIKEIEITYHSVDDALVEALTASCIVNWEEYGRTHQLVIFDDMETPNTPLDDPQNLYPLDSYMQKSFDVFKKKLITNLGLTDAMETKMPLVKNRIDIKEFTIYNVYKQYDSSDNVIGSRVYEYTFRNGSWNVVAHAVNEAVYCYNSFDGGPTLIENTTITAALSFQMVYFPSISFLQEVPGEEYLTDITYQRLVDVSR